MFLSHLSYCASGYKKGQPCCFEIHHFPISYNHVLSIRIENSVDPDQMLYQKPSDLIMQCLQRLTSLA